MSETDMFFFFFYHFQKKTINIWKRRLKTHYTWNEKDGVIELNIWEIFMHNDDVII